MTEHRPLTSKCPCETRRHDLFGDLVEVMHVKGSGRDLGRIDAAGMPAVRLAPLLRLQVLAGLSDADMVNALRAALLDQSAPNPSVEALLHAYLPHPFVDYTHATPFLALANLPEVVEATREIFGTRMALVPYVRPGFGLAMAAAKAYAENPGCEGLVLRNHGHFTWGEDAATSYARVISQANEVAEWLAARRDGPSYPALALAGAEAPPARPAPAPEPAATLLALRGAMGAHLPGDAAMPVFDLRAGAAEHAFMARPDLADLARRGVASPDHVIRTKGFPLLLDAPTLADGPEAIRAAVAGFIADYGRYFATHAPRHEVTPQMLSPLPGLAWIAGLGLVGIGADARAAAIAADIGGQTLQVMQDGEAAGGFRPIGAADLFDMEYWPLEQAKLGWATPPELQGRIVLVTGGAGAIGLATALAFAARGATIFVVDRDAGALASALDRLGPGHDGLACDITAEGAGAAAVAACAARFGGLDILVSNAGAAISGDVATLPEATLRASFELNFFSHMSLSQAAVAAFRAQGRGGQILFNVSKQAANPGIGERIRDKVVASRKRGIWMGGYVPLGYDVQDRKLVVNEAEAANVRRIFQRFIDLGSATVLARELRREGFCNKQGTLIDKGYLYRLLNNRVYRGEALHKGKAYPGEHDVIIDADLWDSVHAILRESPRKRANNSRAQTPALLKGLIFGESGAAMTPTATRKGAKLYRYYVSMDVIRNRETGEETAPMRLAAGMVEDAVVTEVRRILQTPEVVTQVLAALKQETDAASEADAIGALHEFGALWSQLFPAEQARIIQLLVRRVTVTAAGLAVDFRTEGITGVIREMLAPSRMEAAE